MTYNDKDQVETESAQSRGMFFKELPKMLGCWFLFYATLGLGIPWRMGLSREVIWNSAKASLLFAVTPGGVLLAVGAILMHIYALRKARYTGFGPASSLTMLWSFRVSGVVGVLVQPGSDITRRNNKLSNNVMRISMMFSFLRCADRIQKIISHIRERVLWGLLSVLRTLNNPHLHLRP